MKNQREQTEQTEKDTFSKNTYVSIYVGIFEKGGNPLSQTQFPKDKVTRVPISQTHAKKNARACDQRTSHA